MIIPIQEPLNTTASDALLLLPNDERKGITNMAEADDPDTRYTFLEMKNLQLL